jgi:hypothetical protein
MAKDPAFLFYTGDFSTGTQFFTDEQVGKYVRLLMAQHQLGHLHEKHMLQICKTYDKDVFSKFIKDSDGLYYNERLENEVVKRKNYSKSRSENRTTKKNISSTYVEHMENKNENIIVKNTSISNGTWEQEKKLFLNAEQWQYKQCTTYSISKEVLLKHIDTFLARLENQEDYKSEKELKRHFPNWFEKNKDKLNGTALSPTETEIQNKRKNFTPIRD